jgi:hypothetical protein
LLLRVLPPSDAKVSLTSPNAHCVAKTDSALFFSNDDEIWWQAVVGTAHVAPAADPAQPFALKIDVHQPAPVRFPAWNSVDDGSTITFAPAPVVLNDGPIGPAEILSIGLIGLEVDSEAAANAHLADFWDSFFYAWEQIGAVLVAGEGALGTGLAVLKVLGLITVTVALIALAVSVRILQAILALVTIWSVWAAPETIALDVFSLSGRDIADLTNPRKPVPSPVSRAFGGDDEHIWVYQQPIAPKPAGNQAVAFDWVNEYRAEDPGSTYQIRFTLRRAIAG